MELKLSVPFTIIRDNPLAHAAKNSPENIPRIEVLVHHP
jgi:hypothetical protein